ncbi:hypothetical protein DFH11DRAFT_1610399 [Phellopilus nigrolimitatus]|nr:hypothetical protein DFH11DRAFT_1610399 [Phellopilus nigrolimitatus]
MRLLNSFILSFLLTSFTSAQDDRFFPQTPDQLILGTCASCGMDSAVDADFRADPGLMLSDILTVQSAASIFYSYARDTHVGELFKRPDARLTVFAPTNKAVMALARKPNQGPAPVEDGTIISEKEFDERSRENCERWVSAHIVPQHPIRLSPTSQFEALLEGIVITVSSPDSEVHGEVESDSEKPEWARIVLNDNITIASRTEATNGVLYLLDGTFYG